MRYLTLFGVLVLVFLAGCGGGPPIGGDDDAQYTLEILIEKNLDLNTDYLYGHFLREGAGIMGGYVLIDGDSVPTTVTGLIIKTWAGSRYDHGQTISITAVDPEQNFTYNDAIVMPGSFEINNLAPANHLWQNGNVTVEWSTATGADRFLLSVTPSRLPSLAVGASQVVTSGVNAATFTPDAFYDAQGARLIPDLYNIHIVTYHRNFIQRPEANYLSPSIAYDLPISTNQVGGAISAIVVAVRDTIRVNPLP